jgi:hypothetical protein
MKTLTLCRSEELRRARNEEARQLISQRSENPRSVFERNTSAGQLNFRRPATAPKSPAEAPKPPPVAQVTPAAVERSAASAPVEKPPSESGHKSAVVAKENANMVSTDDVVVPPPDSFGNEEILHVHPEPDLTSSTHQPDLVRFNFSKGRLSL